MTTTVYEEIHTTHRIGMRTDVDDGDVHGADYDGYYTIRVKPSTCGCGHVMEYAECNEVHLIVVWEENDDDTMLKAAAYLRDIGGDPKIVEYEADMGKCINFYVAREKKMIG